AVLPLFGLLRRLVGDGLFLLVLLLRRLLDDELELALGALDLLADQLGVADRNQCLATGAFLFETRGGRHGRFSGTSVRRSSRTKGTDDRYCSIIQARRGALPTRNAAGKQEFAPAPASV